MLESVQLRILPWTATGPDGAVNVPPIRLISGPDGDDVLGRVQAIRSCGWLGCRPGRFDVCETEDSSLLMSIEHGWFAFGRWHVVDAEGSRIGSVVGRHLLDERGGRLATIWRETDGSSAIRDRQGQVIARLAKDADGSETLVFDQNLAANPFLRMVLLAACVLQTSP